MKIYTKTGDSGQTGLFGGGRVRKDDLRIEAYGTIDELNSVLGLARAEPIAADVDSLLENIQNALFSLGAELATPNAESRGMQVVGPTHVALLEEAIDRYEATLTPLREFILPSGVRAAAQIHVARTVCRRAERRLVTLAAAVDVSADLIVYLNRLSDLLFVLARHANARCSVLDFPWKKL